MVCGSRLFGGAVVCAAGSGRAAARAWGSAVAARREAARPPGGFSVAPTAWPPLRAAPACQLSLMGLCVAALDSERDLNAGWLGWFEWIVFL